MFPGLFLKFFWKKSWKTFVGKKIFIPLHSLETSKQKCLRNRLRNFRCQWVQKNLFLCRAQQKILHFEKQNAEIAQLVEHNLAKVGVASSSLVFRSHLWNIEKQIAEFLLPVSAEEIVLMPSAAENLVFCETNCGNSSVGRAQPCQGWGREFEPRFPLFW